MKAARAHPRALSWGSRLLPVVAAALAVTVAVPIVVLGDGGRAGTVFASGNDVAVVAPQTNKVIARVPVGSSPTLVREGDGSVWVADHDDQTVTQIDTKGRRVVRTIGIGFRPDDLAVSDGAVWAFDKEGGVLEKLPYEETSNRFERRGFAGFEHMAVDEKAVWLSGGKRLIRVDPRTGRVVKRADVPGDLVGVAVGAGALWAVTVPDGTVLRIDPQTGAVTDRIAIVTRPSALSPRPIGVAADANFVWVLNGRTATVTKIDPKLRGVVAMLPLDVDRGSIRLAAGEGAAWVSNADDGTVTRIDAETDAVTSITVAPHDRPTDVTVGGGFVWVSVDEA